MLRRLRGYRCYVLRIIAFIIFIKVFMKLRLNISQRCNHKEDSIAEYAMRLRVMSDQLIKLKQQNTELTRDRKRAGKTGLENIINIPSLNYEKKRRRIYENTNELWYYIDSELVKLAGEDIKIGVEEAKVRDTTQMIPQITDRIRILLSDQEKLLSFDGFSKWRQKEMESVSSLIQRRLRHLQNPKNCSNAKKVVCKNKACGFGCQMHHIVYCLIFAYATERTLFFDTSMSNGSTGWHRVLLPFSEKCDIYKVEYKMPAGNNTYNDDRQIIYLPEINDLYPDPEFLPLKIPEDLAERIHKFNGDPTSWWIGQFVKYLFKPNKYMQKRIKSYLDQSQFQHPIVGIHVRRPDRIDLDVQFHEFVEYMEHVKDYYDRLELTVPLDKRRIFIATDDTLSYQDVQKLFPTYTIIANRDIASAEEDRPDNVLPILPLLRGFMIDVTMLSMCDHVIGTFSSSLDRLAYELMQGSRDASVNFISLDNIYHFGNRYRDRRVAVLPHKAQSRKYISFKPKDRIIVYGNNYVGYKNGSQKVRTAIDHGNHYVGYSKGLHEQSKRVGQFLWYKTDDVVETFPFPTYKQVPIY